MSLKTDDADPQVVMEALRGVFNDLTAPLKGDSEVFRWDSALRRMEAALPHAERIAALYPLYEELEQAARLIHHECWEGTDRVSGTVKRLRAILTRIEEAKG